MGRWEQEVGLWLKVAIRHKRHLPTGFPPFIPFALLTQSSTSCSGVAVNFFFKEKVLFSLSAAALTASSVEQVVAEVFTGFTPQFQKNLS